MGSVEADDERQIAVADDWQLQRLAHIVRQILRRLVLETSVDHQSKLVQDPLRDIQPVQLSMQ